MPELHYNSLQKDTSLEIRKYLSSRDGYRKQDNGDSKKDKLNPSLNGKFEILSSPFHDKRHVHRLDPSGETTIKKARGKESSKHFGVRFRPDLNKWVAEIRVAEWKTVDKKVWLGTFETEEGAARAVDAARKLLKCSKKRPSNFPCIELDAYLEQIPHNLNLNNLGNEAMFKDVTLFVKKKAQEYAASFATPSNNHCVSKQVPVICETSVYSQAELPHANLQEDMSLDSEVSFPSCENWISDGVFPLCEIEVATDQWQQLCGGDSISQRCNFESVKSFHENDFSDWIHCSLDNNAIDVSHTSWEDFISGGATLEYSEPLPGYHAPDQTISTDVISGDEMSCDSFSIFSECLKPSSGIVDSNMDWMLQFQSHNSIFTGSDCTQVY